MVEEIAAYRRALDDLAEAEAMLADPEMKALAEEEMPALKARIPEMEQALRLALVAEGCGGCAAGDHRNPARARGATRRRCSPRTLRGCISAMPKAMGWRFEDA